MPGIDGLTFLSKVKNSHPDLPVIIMTAHSDLESAVSSYQTGAFEYLPKPFDIDEALALVNRAILHTSINCSSKRQNSFTTTINRNYWRISCYARGFPSDWSFISVAYYRFN